MDLVAALECLLFVSERPIPASQLAQALQVDPAELLTLVACLRDRLENHGLQVQEIAGGFRLLTRPQFSPIVERFLSPPPLQLSEAALETLAIVAYRQPITRPEIEAIRGVSSHAPLKTLLEHGMLVVKGRKPVPGRPLQYGTADRFLDHFGLRDITDLPQLSEDLKLTERAFPSSFLPEEGNHGL